MATRLYLHAATNSTANLPTAEQSSKTSEGDFEGSQTTNRQMTTTIGAAQTSLARNTLAGDVNAHTYYCSRWVSPPLDQTSISANTWTYNFAATEQAAATNFPVAGNNVAVPVNCYVWRPGTGKVGTILDGNTAATVDEATSGEVSHHVTFSGSAVAGVQTGDVIIFEAWFTVDPATGGNDDTMTFYYDGTTANAADNQTVSNHASFIETPENLTFFVASTNYNRAPATETVTISESIARIYGQNRSIDTEIVSVTDSPVRLLTATRNPIETTNLTETLTRLLAASRYLGGSSLQFDGSNDYVDCTNDATLWSQALTKFSFSLWIYPTGMANRRVVQHYGTVNSAASAQGFGLSVQSGPNIVRFQIQNAANSTIQAEATATQDAWNHIACVYDNTLGSANLKVYVNGTVGDTTGNLTETINKSAQLILADGSTDFIGYMKDFRWYSTIALNQTQIDDIRANNGSAPTPDYWLQMNEHQGNPVDSITGTKVGTLSGTLWAERSPTVWPNENYTISDTIERVRGVPRSIDTETVTVSDSTARMLASTRTLQEDTISTETLTRLLAANRSIDTEIVSITDQITRVRSAVATIAAETVTISDSVTRMLATNRNMEENTTVSDSIDRLLATNRLLETETVAITDQVARLLAATRTIDTETAAVSDSIQRVKGAVRTIETETTTISDAVARLLAANRAIVETVSITDSVTGLMQGPGQENLERSISETVVISESLTRMLAATRTIATETTTINDNITRQLTASRTIDIEATSMSDVVARVFGAVRPITIQTIAVTDAVVRSAGRVRTIIENVISSDSVTRLMQSIRQMLETVSLVDSLSRQLAASRTIDTETTTVSDSLTRLLTRVRTIVESIDITDSITRAFVGARPILESINITDSLVRLITPFEIPTRLKKIRQWLTTKYSETDPSL